MSKTQNTLATGLTLPAALCATFILALALNIQSTFAAIENDALPGERGTPLLVGYSPTVQLNAAEIQVELQRLTTQKTVLYLAAHPDDENQGVLTWCRSELGVRTGYLSLTRGDGGQNLIGSEKGDALGVLRTEELLSARRVDGAEQFFTRALDFGYSKTIDETLAAWNKDSILADVVWVIRNFQPDIIITRFPGDGQGGHGHHTASTQLAVLGAEAAKDPSKFPEQLKQTSTWEVQSVLWNSWMPEGPLHGVPTKSVAQIETGMFNSLLGESYLEIAARARSRHRCQGFGASPQRGQRTEYFWQLYGKKPSDSQRLFSDAELYGIGQDQPGSANAMFNLALNNYDPENPQAVTEYLLKALEALRQAPTKTSLNLAKQRATQRLIAAVNGMWLEARSFAESVAPGDSLRLQVRLLQRNRMDNNSAMNADMQLRNINLIVDGMPAQLQAGGVTLQRDLTIEETVLLPAEMSLSQPYWLRNPKNGAMYAVPDQQQIGRAWNAPEVYVTCGLMIGSVPVTFALPLRYRWTDPTLGERFKPLEVTPPATVTFTRPTQLFIGNESRPLSVKVKSYRDGLAGRVNLEIPRGWRLEPASFNFELNKGIEQVFEFSLRPPAENQEETVFKVRALAIIPDGMLAVSEGEEVIDYEHVPRHTIFSPSTIKVMRSSIENSALVVGYIMGSGDKVPEALEQMDARVDLLSDEMLTNMDLNNYDAIIAGIRAYNTREHLRQVQDKLMEYVKDGGVYVVQYNTNRGTVVDELGPYEFNLSRGRVTDETATMQLLAPDHDLLNIPNKIRSSDFDDWIQERGLYFAVDMDDNYEMPFASQDKGEEALDGSVIYAQYGKGVFIYTGISFFRQLPAGVAGAFKLFANIVSGGRE